MSSKMLRVNVVLILILAVMLILSAITSSWMWLVFVIPVFIYVLATLMSMSDCENCGKPIGHEVIREKPVFVAISMPTLTCRHCGHKH